MANENVPIRIEQNDGEARKVASKLKADEVWGVISTAGCSATGWISVKGMTDAELVKARDYIEQQYEEMPTSLPHGEVGGRMLLRYLNTRIPRNDDINKSFCIRAVCVYPKSVDFEWEDAASRKCRYVVSENEMRKFPDHIRQQMDNWKRRLFEISGGKFSLTYEIQSSIAEMESLTRARDGHYWLSPTPASKLAKPDEDVMIYIFWLPKWEKHPPIGLAGHFNVPYRTFPAAHIAVYTDENRLNDPMGWVNLDSGLPHEFWHYMRYLAREVVCVSLPMPDDDEQDRPGWQQLKWEIAIQDLPVPQEAHKEQYANVLTWRFVETLRMKYNVSIV